MLGDDLGRCQADGADSAMDSMYFYVFMTLCVGSPLCDAIDPTLHGRIIMIMSACWLSIV